MTGSVIHEMAKRLQRHMWLSACRLVALITPTPPPVSDDVVAEAKDQGADGGLEQRAEVGEGGGEGMAMDNAGGIDREEAEIHSGVPPILEIDHDGDDDDDDDDDDIEVVDVDDDDTGAGHVVDLQPAADTGVGSAGGEKDNDDAVAAVGGMSNGGGQVGEGRESEGIRDEVMEKNGLGIAGGPRKRRKK